MLLETKVATNSLTETQKQSSWKCPFTKYRATYPSLMLIDLHRLQTKSDLHAVINTTPNMLHSSLEDHYKFRSILQWRRETDSNSQGQLMKVLEAADR